MKWMQGLQTLILKVGMLARNTTILVLTHYFTDLEKVKCNLLYHPVCHSLYYQSVKLHNAIIFQMLHRVVTFNET